MADFTTLSASTAYPSLLPQISGRDDDLAMMLDPTYASPTNVKTNFQRLNSALGKIQRFNGTSWVDALSSWNITGTLSSSGNATFGDGTTSGALNVNINAPLANSAGLNWQAASSTKWSLYRVLTTNALQLDNNNKSGVLSFDNTSGNATFGYSVSIANSATVTQNDSSAQLRLGRTNSFVGYGRIGADSSYVFAISNDSLTTTPFLINQNTPNNAFSLSSTGLALGVAFSATFNGVNTTFGNASNDSGVGLQILGGNTQKNWLVSSNLFTGGNFEITPSTTNGGSTFTTPIFKLSTSGLVLTGISFATQYTSTSSSSSLPGFAVSAGNGSYNSGANQVGISCNSTQVANFSTSAITAVAVPVNEAVGSSIASATTINLTTATGNGIHITGTTAITAVTLGAGMRRTVIFDGTLTLTHHSINNNLPGGLNITTAAGDRATYWSDGTTVYCTSYVRADGTTPTSYISTGNALPAANTVLSVNHGLGSMPSSWSVSIVCATADQGYSVGDEIDVSGLIDGDGGRMTSSWANSTTIGFITSVASCALSIRSRSINGTASITPANWTLTFRARK
jgi:hypothetical protein